MENSNEKKPPTEVVKVIGDYQTLRKQRGYTAIPSKVNELFSLFLGDG
jgi:hypothetical protein